MNKQVRYPLAFCPQHGVFPAQVFPMAPGAAFHIAGIATTCPICKGTSNILDGYYEAKADQLNVLLDPSISAGALAAIKELVLKLQTGSITPDQAVKEAEKIHPKAGGLFSFLRLSDPNIRTQYIVLVIGIVAQLAIARYSAPSPPSTVMQNQPVAERVVTKDDLLTTSALSPPKIPLPRPRPNTAPGKKHPR